MRVSRCISNEQWECALFDSQVLRQKASCQPALGLALTSMKTFRAYIVSAHF
jgi:hypothetical protein